MCFFSTSVRLYAPTRPSVDEIAEYFECLIDQDTFIEIVVSENYYYEDHYRIKITYPQYKAIEFTKLLMVMVLTKFK